MSYENSQQQPQQQPQQGQQGQQGQPGDQAQQTPNQPPNHADQGQQPQQQPQQPQQQQQADQSPQQQQQQHQQLPLAHSQTQQSSLDSQPGALHVNYYENTGASSTAACFAQHSHLHLPHHPPPNMHPPPMPIAVQQGQGQMVSFRPPPPYVAPYFGSRLGMLPQYPPAEPPVPHQHQTRRRPAQPPISVDRTRLLSSSRNPPTLPEPDNNTDLHVSTNPNTNQTVYSFVPLPGAAQQKRPRRRFEDIERIYHCNYPGCTKGYGTLNHLNAHVTMQRHGPKRLPDEFREARREHKARRKEAEKRKKSEQQKKQQQIEDGEEEAQAQQGSSSSSQLQLPGPSSLQDEPEQQQQLALTSNSPPQSHIEPQLYDDGSASYQSQRVYMQPHNSYLGPNGDGSSAAHQHLLPPPHQQQLPSMFGGGYAAPFAYQPAAGPSGHHSHHSNGNSGNGVHPLQQQQAAPYGNPIYMPNNYGPPSPQSGSGTGGAPRNEASGDGEGDNDAERDGEQQPPYNNYFLKHPEEQ